MMTIWNFLTVHVAWQAYLLLVGAVAVALAIIAKAYGWRLPAPVLTALAVAGGLLVVLARAKQQGYNLRKADEATANQQAKSEFDKLQTQNENKTDAQLDQENDRWLRP